MSKSIAMLAFVVAGQFSLAQAADQRQFAGSESAGPDVSKVVTSGAIKFCTMNEGVCRKRASNGPEDLIAEEGRSQDQAPVFSSTNSLKTPHIEDESRSLLADYDSSLHPTLTDDPTEFQELLPQNQSLVHVDFSSVSGQTAPLFVEGNNFAVGIFGNAQALNSYEGMPASNWFGDSADSTFVLANGSLQIVFPQDVAAASLLTSTTGIKEKLSAVSDDQSITTLSVALLDANGTMIGTSLIHLSDGVKELDIPSEVRFRSLIISSTSTHWMFSNLAYKPDSSEMM